MTMVEKVAKALYENSGLTYSNKNYWQALAKIAIEATRVPTEEMLAAKDKRGDPVLWDCNCNICGGPKENWNIMIDAALKEAPDAG